MYEAPQNVSGHDFSRAERAQTKDSGFSPCGLPTQSKHSHGYFRVSVLFCAVSLFFISISALPAQSIQTISPQQCVWRAGDNPAWAAPSFDDSAWQPYTQWTFNSDEPRIWVRCRADLRALSGTQQPALQASVPAAYDLFLNGTRIGGAGNLHSGNFSMDTIRSFPLPQPVPTSHAAVLAARINYGYPVLSALVDAAPIAFRAGDGPILDALRSGVVLARIHRFLNWIICFSILGVLAFVLFGLFLSDRSRLDLLLLGVYSLGLAAIYGSRFSVATRAGFSVSPALAAYAIAAGVVILARTWIVFVLARRRIPLVFWILIWFVIVRSIVTACGAFVPFAWSDSLARAVAWTTQGYYYSNLACAFAPFVAFWPYNRIQRPMLPLAILCMAWGAFMVAFFLSGSASFSGRVSERISFMVGAELLVSLCVIVALMGLLFRQQQRNAMERAELAGEMASAREIQRYFIPDKLPDTPGLAIQSVYLPAREVGGDFFQVLPDTRDGSTLIVVGDVAGKGLKAGMLSALIVGAIRTASQFTREPGEILALLNQRLQGRGLVTCLALRIHRDGNAELANAGHLPPYLNGKELALEGSLPLGAAPANNFGFAKLRLMEGESMLLVSDGIVEAQNARGELFGFDRTAALSTQSAEAIAAAAQQFGQEDDITVLTLTFAPAEVLHA